MDKLKGSFFHCVECDDDSYKFDCCGNSICNGSGCEVCNNDELRQEILNQLDQGYMDLANDKEFVEKLIELELDL